METARTCAGRPVARKIFASPPAVGAPTHLALILPPWTMPYSCPACRQPALATARRIVFPGDRRADEIALATLACACGFKAIAVTEQLKRMNLRADAAPVGFRLPGPAVDLLDFLIARCPDPGEEFCPCPAHMALNRRDLRNGWNLLRSFAPFSGFALEPDGAAPAARCAIAPAPLAWARNGDGYRAAVGGRAWHLYPDSPLSPAPCQLAVAGALEFELDAWPPFWRLGASRG
jgi:hypothetical protein